ncbi:TPA: LapA family protein, partial [Staphylococcus aureus]|nr:LapA family protein [Staphylococcus aureus]
MNISNENTVTLIAVIIAIIIGIFLQIFFKLPLIVTAVLSILLG